MNSLQRNAVLGLCVALIASAASAVPQSTLHVDVHAPPGGDGSATAPFQDVQSGIDAAANGDTVLVHPGIYQGQVVMPGSRAVHVKSAVGPTATVLRRGAGANVVECNAGIVEGFTILKTAGSLPSCVVALNQGALRRCILVGVPTLTGVNFDSGVVEHCLVTECREPLAFTPHSAGAIRNSILWNNALVFAWEPPAASSLSLDYCVIDEVLGPPPQTNIDQPPLVRSFASRDYHLRATSPCIDAGDPASPLDPDGSRADIGPLPFDPSYAPFTVYCTAKLNSLGCTPSISATGNASASAPTPFEITCSEELNQRPGLLFYGFGPKNVAYQGGYLCVQSPVRRTALLDSGGTVIGDDCSGVYVYDFNARIQSGVDSLLEPGVEVFAQFWSRDSGASFTTNRSDAIRFTVLP